MKPFARRPVLPIMVHLFYGLFYAYAAYFCVLCADGRESENAIRIGIGIQTFLMFAYAHLGLPYRKNEFMIRHKKLLLPGFFAVIFLIAALSLSIRNHPHPMNALGLPLAGGYVLLVALHTRSFLNAGWPPGN